MVKVTVYKNENHQSVGFKTLGHAGYAEAGQDIVCSAISILTINTLNSIEKFTDDAFKAEAADGMVRWKFTELPLSKEAHLLMDSLVLGLQDIQENYGKKYIKIIEKRLT